MFWRRVSAAFMGGRQITSSRRGPAGLVICRQSPGTAKGFVFVSLEDETSLANAIITAELFECCRLLIERRVRNVDRVMRLQEMREAAGLSKYGLARESGISRGLFGLLKLFPTKERPAGDE